MKHIAAIVALFVLSIFAFAQSTGAGYQEVKPGEKHDNKDVQVENRKDSRGKAKVTPKTAAPCGKVDHVDCFCTTNSEVSFGNNAKFEVKGVEAGDTVKVSTGCKGEIHATGGTVEFNGSGTSVTIYNDAPPGGDNVSYTAGGYTTTIPPGSNVTVNS
jgi:hypothetical protein